MKFLNSIIAEGQIEAAATGFKFPDETVQDTAATPLSVSQTPPSEMSPPSTVFENTTVLQFAGLEVSSTTPGTVAVVSAPTASGVAFTPTAEILSDNVQEALEEVRSAVGGDGGGSLIVKESDGSPSVSGVTELQFEGATVEEVSAGVVKVAISGSGGSSPVLATNAFVATASQTDFILTNIPLSDGIVYVSRDGVVAKASDWSLIGSTVTFGTGVEAGVEVQVVYWRTAPDGTTPIGEGFVATSGQTDFSLSHPTGAVLVVSLNGVVQSSTAWSVVGGSTLTFGTGRFADDVVWISYLY
jgi:hypothetical protein